MEKRFIYIIFIVVTKSLLVLSLFAQDEIVVSTYNIRFDNPNDPISWEDRGGEVAKAIIYFDIVGLQEVLPNQFKDIKLDLPRMSSYGLTRNGDGTGEACPIFWHTDNFDLLHSETRWLSESWSDTASVGWDADMPRIASIVLLSHRSSGQIVRVINSHWSHTGTQARKASAALIRSWAVKGEADIVIVLGDFNAESESDEIRFLLSSDLQDSYVVAKTRCRKKFGTFTGFDPAGLNGPRIDYILVDGAEVIWTCADEYLKYGFYISDHLPVHASLSIQKH